MSKITKALEKAARERLKGAADQPTTAAKPTEVRLAPARNGDAIAIGSVQIDPHIISATDPTSPIAEQYRILRTNLQSLKSQGGARTILITSSVHAEGKSVTSLNLALTLAQQEQMRVLLIDADLRRGTLHQWLGIKPERGLSTALSDSLGLDGALVRLQSPPLTILPGGPPPDHPAELLESNNMRRLLAILKTQFDVIIIDAPPVLPVADAGILSGLVDGVLLIVRAGKTQRKVVHQAKALLRQTKAKLLGCILTHVEYYIPGYYRYYRYRSAEQRRDAAKRDGISPVLGTIVPPTPAGEPSGESDRS